MEKLLDTYNQRPTVTTGFNKLKPTVTTVEGTKTKLTKQEVMGCDIGLSDYADIMSPKFYAWYCKAWYKLGRGKFDLLASMARADGKDPAKLFSKLIKVELNKLQ